MIKSSEFKTWHKKVIKGNIDKQVDYVIQSVSSQIFNASKDPDYTDRGDTLFFVITCKYTRSLLYNKTVLDKVNIILEESGWKIIDSLGNFLIIVI